MSDTFSTTPWSTLEPRAPVPPTFGRAATMLFGLAAAGATWMLALPLLITRPSWFGHEAVDVQRICEILQTTESACLADLQNGMFLFFMYLAVGGVAAVFVIGVVLWARSTRKGDRWTWRVGLVALPIFLWQELSWTVQTPAWIVLVTAIPAMVFTVGALWYLVIAPSSRGYLRRYRR